MYEWCHTGLEGYCKSAAKLLDDFIEADLTEEERPKKNEVKKRESESALHLCQDLLPDRNADNISALGRSQTRGRDVAAVSPSLKSAGLVKSALSFIPMRLSSSHG